MSECRNCYNGCVETTSDRCVKYTGENYPALNIETGDSLAVVEKAIIDELYLLIAGTGVQPVISQVGMCDLVKSLLPSSGTITLVQYLTALITAACTLDTRVTVTEGKLNTIEANYTIGCLTGVSANSGTHAILQAVITKLCSVDSTLTALALEVSTNYVRVDEIDSYISAYIASIPSTTAMRSRMVPYTVVEYYGTLSNFDASGAGIGDWEQVYLCNGANLTPDKRGYSPIGAIQGVPGGIPFAPRVDPVNPSNPNYSLKQANGSNTVILTSGQMPSHTHVATVTPVGDHTHNQTGKVEAGSNEGSGGNDNPVWGNYPTSPAGGHTHTVTNSPAGNNEAHLNIHPVLACYYIMYIPSAVTTTTTTTV